MSNLALLPSHLATIHTHASKAGATTTRLANGGLELLWPADNTNLASMHAIDTSHPGIITFSCAETSAAIRSRLGLNIILGRIDYYNNMISLVALRWQQRGLQSIFFNTMFGGVTGLLMADLGQQNEYLSPTFFGEVARRFLAINQSQVSKTG